MNHNHLRALIAAPIYVQLRSMHFGDGVSVLMRDALEEADDLLELVSERPEDPENDAPSAMAPGDPFFVIHAETSKAISSPGDMPPHPEQWTNTGNRVLFEAIEQIDAGMFRGDAFQGLVAIQYLEWHIGRWVREISRTRRMLPAPAPPVVTPPRVYPQTYEQKCSICRGTDHVAETCPEDIPF